MKNIILLSCQLFSVLVSSQTLKNSLIEDFNNYNNGWKLNKSSTSWNSNIINGKLEFTNNNSNDCIYLRPNDLKIQEKGNYEIETVLKVSINEDYSLAGVIFIDEENTENSG
jgi:hypothetical protein